jgi:4-hydroxy-tetrahydrodipicolinate synthase
VLVGAGGNDTAKIVKTIKTFAAAFPVDGFMSVSPYYNKPSQTGIYHHYLTVASATDRPLVLYNVPPRTGSNVCADTTLRLAHDVPHIVAVKEASGSLEQIGVIVRDRPAGFRVLCGDDSIALPSIAIGCDGLVSVLGNGLPHAVSQLVGAALSGQLAEARAWHLRLLSAIELIFAEGNPTGIKALVELVGIGSRSVRQPLWPASDALVEQLRALLPLATLPQAA